MKANILVGALNISANPHPDEIYIDSLNAATRLKVNARGSDYAKITVPKQDDTDTHLYTGRILLWTEIEKLGKWLDTTKEEELTEDQLRSIKIPDNAKPNFRVFEYVFIVDKHKLCFETKNETGQSLGPTTARNIFANLLSHESLGEGSPEFTVSVVPKAGTVDSIFEIPQLRVLKIRVERPNADTTSSDAVKRVNEYLNNLHAQRVEQTFVRSNDAIQLTPTQEIRDFAMVGSENGFVKGIGKSSDGEQIEISTENHPKLISVSAKEGSNLLTRIRSIINIF